MSTQVPDVQCHGLYWACRRSQSSVRTMLPASCFVLAACCLLLPALACCSCFQLGRISIIQLVGSVPFRLLFSACEGSFPRPLVRDTVISGTECALLRRWIVQGPRDRFFFSPLLGPKDRDALGTGPRGRLEAAGLATDAARPPSARRLSLAPPGTAWPPLPGIAWYGLVLRAWYEGVAVPVAVTCNLYGSIVPYGTVMGSSGAKG